MGSDKIAELNLKYSGLFNLKSFYNSIINYLKNLGFSYKEEKLEYKDEGDKIDIETEISFEKKYDSGIKVSGTIELKIEGAKEVIVKEANLTRTMNKAENVEINLSADYENKFGEDLEGELSKLLAKIYKETLGKPHFDKIKDTAKKDMEGLVEEIKKELNLYRYLN